MRLREKKNLSRFAFPYIIAANLLKAFFSVLHQTTEIEGVQSRKCTDVAVEKEGTPPLNSLVCLQVSK